MNVTEAEQKRLREITQISNVVRQKYKALKNFSSANENALEELFKPVVTPLKQLVDVSKNDGVEKHSIKVEPVKNEDIKNDVNNELEADMTNDDIDMIEPELTDDDDDNDGNNSVEKSLHNKSIYNDEEVVALLNQYLTQIKKKNNKEFDYACGVRILQSGYHIGDKTFDYQNGYIRIGGGKYKFKATPGLLELIFKAKPDSSMCTSSDIANYKAIILRTNAHRKYHLKTGDFKTKDPKFINFIAKLLGIKTGTGLPKYMVAKYPKKSVDYIHYDDVNELVERLQLLMASKAAGNDSHSNEILSIIEELREEGIIY